CLCHFDPRPDFDLSPAIPMKRLSSINIVAALLTSFLAPWAPGQYPTVPADVAAAAARAKAEADRRSDEAWERAHPVVEEWASKGKPYIPWASHPTDLKQAPIPAFPGAWGGGMYR